MTLSKNDLEEIERFAKDGQIDPSVVLWLCTELRKAWEKIEVAREALYQTTQMTGDADLERLLDDALKKISSIEDKMKLYPLKDNDGEK